MLQSDAPTTMPPMMPVAAESECDRAVTRRRPPLAILMAEGRTKPLLRPTET